MSAAEVPTGLAHVCTTVEEVEEALDALGAPHVVKDDGLAAGKGVVVTDDRAAALEHARTCLAKPDGAVVVEEYLSGPGGVAVLPLRRHDRGAAEPGPGLQAGRRRRRRAQHRGDGRVQPARLGPGGARRRRRPARGAARRRRDAPSGDAVRRGALRRARADARAARGSSSSTPASATPRPRSSWPGCSPRSAGCSTPRPRGGSTRPRPCAGPTDHAVTVVVAAANYPGDPRTGDPVTGADDVGGRPGGVRPARRDGPGRRRHPRLGGRPGALGRRDGQRPSRRPASGCTRRSSRHRAARLAPPQRHRAAGRARRGHRLERSVVVLRAASLAAT